MSSTAPFICSRCLKSAQRITTIPRKYHNRATLTTSTCKLSSIQTSRQIFTSSTQSTRSMNKGQHHYSTATPHQIKAFPPPPPPQPNHLKPQPSSQSSPHLTSAAPTLPLLNPQFSEAGTPLEITITPRAAHRLKQLITKDDNPALALRITVESGGCHGFQYLMSVTDQADEIDMEEDTLFVYDSDGSLTKERVEADGGKIDPLTAIRLAEGKAKVVMDSASLELLEGSKVDYTMELIGSQFKIVDNPRATSSCGCGTSFDVNI